jgi:hypothetical protein
MESKPPQTKTTQSKAPPSKASQPKPPASPIALDDLWAQARWPLLLRAPGVALRPAHVGLALVTIVLLLLLLSIPDAVRASREPGATPREATPTRTLERSLDDLDLSVRQARVWRATQDLAGAPVALVREHPRWMLALMLPGALVLGVGLGAIARSAVLHVGLAEREPWARSLAGSIRKCWSLAGALLAPALVCAILWGVIAGLGAALFSWTPGAYIGGGLYALALLLALAIVLVGVVGALGLPMLAPAVMTEDTDGVDGVQRVYAYVIARPRPFAMYMIIVLAQMAVVVALAWLAVRGALWVAAHAAAAWAPEPFAESIRQRGVLAPSERTYGLAEWHRGSLAAIGFWAKATLLLVPAIALSYAATAGSVLYLAMRRTVDGQHESDLWALRPTRARPASVRDVDDDPTEDDA